MLEAKLSEEAAAAHRQQAGLQEQLRISVAALEEKASNLHSETKRLAEDGAKAKREIQHRLNAQVNVLEEKLAGLTASNQKLKSGLALSASQVSSLEAKLAASNSSATKIKHELAGKIQTLAASGSKVKAELEKKLATSESSRQKLERDLKASASTVSALHKQLKGAETQQQAEKKRLEMELKEAKTNLATARSKAASQIERLENELNATRIDMASSQGQIQMFQNRERNLQSEIELLREHGEGNRRELEKRLEESDSRTKVLEQKVQECTARCQALHQSLAAARSAAKENAELANRKFQTLLEAHQALRAEDAANKKERDGSLSHIKTLETKLGRSESKIQQLVTDLTTAKAEAARLLEETTLLRQQSVTAIVRTEKESKETMATNRSLRARLQQFEVRDSNSLDEMESLKEECEALRKKLEQSESKANSFEAKLAKVEESESSMQLSPARSGRGCRTAQQQATAEVKRLKFELKETKADIRHSMVTIRGLKKKLQAADSRESDLRSELQIFKDESERKLQERSGDAAFNSNGRLKTSKLWQATPQQSTEVAVTAATFSSSQQLTTRSVRVGQEAAAAQAPDVLENASDSEPQASSPHAAAPVQQMTPRRSIRQEHQVVASGEGPELKAAPCEAPNMASTLITPEPGTGKSAFPQEPPSERTTSANAAAAPLQFGLNARGIPRRVAAVNNKNAPVQPRGLKRRAPTHTAARKKKAPNNKSNA